MLVKEHPIWCFPVRQGCTGSFLNDRSGGGTCAAVQQMRQRQRVSISCRLSAAGASAAAVGSGRGAALPVQHWLDAAGAGMARRGAKISDQCDKQVGIGPCAQHHHWESIIVGTYVTSKWHTAGRGSNEHWTPQCQRSTEATTR